MAQLRQAATTPEEDFILRSSPVHAFACRCKNDLGPMADASNVGQVENHLDCFHRVLGQRTRPANLLRGVGFLD